jgi:hypothetical protein
MNEILESKRRKLDPARVKVGDIMAFVHYVKVKKVNDGGMSLQLQDLDGDQGEFVVRGARLIASSFSADQYHEEQRVSMTRAAEILVSSFNRPLTVCFIKKRGDERLLRGRLLQPEPLLGRSHVLDLDVSGKNRIRLVDHRTIKYLIVDGVKYTVTGRR